MSYQPKKNAKGELMAQCAAPAKPLDTVWIKTRVSNGEVTIHRELDRESGYRMTESFNRDGQPLVEMWDGYGSIRFVWTQVPLYR
jgi:hypothetical protein